jgi:ribose/xylose/arabinose/galactoside ABC-type transport system permease subunit
MNSRAPDPAAVDEFGAAEPGRPVVLEPTPPGMWRALLGMAVAVLAPLLGFLVGGILGVGTVGDSIDPMVLSLFIGIIIGGIGLLVALSGGARLWTHFHREDATEA